MIHIFKNLFEQILSQDNVDYYINCHIKKKNANRENKCTLCKAEQKFMDYEGHLFNVKYTVSENSSLIDSKEDDVKRRQGNWNESPCIVALKRLAQLYKSKGHAAADYELLVEEIDKFSLFIEEIKKEFKTHRKFWTHLSEFIFRIDELNQAQTRYVSSLDTDDCENLDVKLKLKMEHDLKVFSEDKSYAERKLCTDLDRLKYLLNLKNSLKDKDHIESRMCSICWCDLTRYYILACGHFFCMECIIQLEKQTASTGEIKCSVCRAVCRKMALCCIDTDQIGEQIGVKGSWSTKLLRVLRCVIKLTQSKEKILIFSSWLRILEIMKTALDMNEINSFILTSSDANFVSKLKSFQNTQTHNVLLLPINFACNGLNLTEATHVIFINSSLNKADELQAIGRIYRIGQTRQTFVHKFIIKDSIEQLIENHHEAVYHRLRNKNSEFNNLTVREFFNLID